MFRPNCMCGMVNQVYDTSQMKSKPGLPDPRSGPRYVSAMHKRASRPSIGRRIRELRKLRGLTQEQLAAQAGVSSVKMIESGRTDGSIEFLGKIADTLGCCIVDFFIGNGDGKINPVLRDFLSSPMAKGVTPYEIEELKKVHAFGRAPTMASYCLSLQAIRSMEEKPK